MYTFRNTTNYGFCYVFEKTLKPNEIAIIKMPSISPNKRGVNDIGWQTDGDAVLYGTLSSNPTSENAMWEKIEENFEVNKTVYAIKVVNGLNESKVAIRVILN